MKAGLTKLFAAVVLALVMAVAMGACMTERTPIDKTNPLALDKRLFEGQWFFKQTVVDKPYRFDVTFLGETNDLKILEWEITESWLIGYDIHDHFEAAGTDGIMDQGRPPVVAYPIADHFDIKVAENSTTGEDLPMLVENRDNPWWQRRYIIIDPSSSAVSVYQLKYMNMTVEWANPFRIEPMAGYTNLEFYDKTENVIDPKDYEKRYVLGGENLVNMFSFINEATFTANNDWRSIYTWEDVNEFINWDPMRVAFRNYFWRVDRNDPLLADFRAMEFQDNLFRRFGYFVRDYFGIDPQHGQRENYYHKWANRYNTETVTRNVTEKDADGNDVTVEKTINHQIEYFMGPDYPERLLMSACSVAADYNHIFKHAEWASKAENQGKEDTWALDNRQKRLKSFWLSNLTASSDNPETFTAELDDWPAENKLDPNDYYYIDYLETDADKVQAFYDYCFPTAENQATRKFLLRKNWFMPYDYIRDGVNPEGIPNMITQDELAKLYSAFYLEKMIDTEKTAKGPVACKLDYEHRCAVDSEGNKIPRWGVELGDGRHSMFYWVTKASEFNPLGVSQWSDDPETGQIFTAVAHIFGTDMQAWISRELERFEVIRGLKESARPFDPSAGRWGQIISETISSAEHTRVPTQSEAGTTPDEEVNPLPPLPGTPRYNMSAAYNNMLGRGITAETADEFDAEFQKQGLGLEVSENMDARLDALRPPEYKNNWDIDQVKGTKWETQMASLGTLDYLFPDATEYDENMLYQVSPVYWGSPTKMAELAQREINFSKGGYFMSEWLDGGYLALMSKMQDDLGYNMEQIRRTVEAIAFKGTLEHEAGHCLGLRHNFRGSIDEANYSGLERGTKKSGYAMLKADHAAALQGKIDEFVAENGRNPDPWETHYIDKQLGHVIKWYEYASIMDYHDNFYYTAMGLGNYDRAAFLYAYAWVVEKYMTEGDTVALDDGGAPKIKLEPLFEKRPCNSGDIYLQDCACTPGMMLQSDIDAGYECSCTDYMGQETCYLDGKETFALRIENEVTASVDEDGNTKFTKTGYPKEIQLNGDTKMYQFCTDDQVYEDPMCNRWDSGSTAAAITRGQVDQYNMFYYWRMLRRGNPRFRRHNWWQSAFGMFGFAHFALDLNYNRFQLPTWRNILLDQSTDPFAEGTTIERKEYLLALNGYEQWEENGKIQKLTPGGPGDYLIAAMEGFNFLVYDVIYRPDVGKHLLTSWKDNSAVQYFVSNPYIYDDSELEENVGGAIVDVDLRFGRYHKNHWNRQDDPALPTEKQTIRGFSQEKNAASFILYNSGWWVDKYRYESMANAFHYLSDGFLNAGYDIMSDTINEESMFNFTPYCVHQTGPGDYEVKRFRPRTSELFFWNSMEEGEMGTACASDTDCTESEYCWLKEDGNWKIAADDETTIGYCMPTWAPKPSDPSKSFCQKVSEETGEIYIPLHASWVYFDKMMPSFWAMLNTANTMADQSVYWYYNTAEIPAHEYAVWTSEDTEEYNVNVIDCLNEKENIYYRAYNAIGQDHKSPIYQLVKRCANIRGTCMKAIGKGMVPGNFAVGDETCSNGYPAWYMNRELSTIEATFIMLNEYVRFWTGIGTTAWFPLGDDGY